MKRIKSTLCILMSLLLITVMTPKTIFANSSVSDCNDGEILDFEENVSVIDDNIGSASIISDPSYVGFEEETQNDNQGISPLTIFDTNETTDLSLAMDHFSSSSIVYD